MKKMVLTVAATVALALTGSASATIIHNTDVTPTIIYGSGNANGNFSIDQNAGVELGLRAKIPYTGLSLHDGNGVFSFNSAEILASGVDRWNFDFTVNSDFDGTSGFNLDDLTYLLAVDFDPTTGTSFTSFDPISQSTGFFAKADHAIGNNSTANGGGATTIWGSTYRNRLASNNVLQQSWALGMSAVGGPAGYDVYAPGTYDINFSAFYQGNEIAATSIQVVINDGLPVTNAPVPEPATMTLLGLGLAGLGLRARKRKRA